MIDDIMDDQTESKAQKTEEYLNKIIENSLTIRNVIKEIQADNLVLELCDERFEEEISQIIQHPNYDRTFTTVQRMLDEKPERLLKYDQVALDVGSFEMLVAFDTCSYRTPCKAIMGDRDFSITQKRFQAKSKLLDLYKQQAVQKPKSTSSTSNTAAVDINDTIFEVS